MSKEHKEDRRSKRSRQLIGDALVELMLERSFDAITVQDILDRADVGRSTFYAHYTDKEDLLSEQIAHVIRELDAYTAHAGQAHGGILPSLALFRHVQEQNRLLHAFLGGHGLERYRHGFLKQVSQIVEQNIRALVDERATFAVPLPLVADYVVSTFLMLLQWWFDNGMRQTPEEMDEYFRALVMPSLRSLMKTSEKQV
jgi:AcrR family transcriptional regulator